MTNRTRTIVVAALSALLFIAGDVFARGGGGGGRGGGGMRGGGARSSGSRSTSRPSSSSGGSVRQSSPGRSSGYSNTPKQRPAAPTQKPSATQRPSDSAGIKPRPAQPSTGTGAGAGAGAANRPSQQPAGGAGDRAGVSDRAAGDKAGQAGTNERPSNPDREGLGDKADAAREDRQQARKEQQNDRQKAAKNRQEDRQDWAEDQHDDYWNGGWSVSIGVGISTLPAGSAAIAVGGGSYYHHGGFWYAARPGGGYVACIPPVGCHLPCLPVGYYTFWLHNHCYYYYGGTYYSYDEDESQYEVIEAPVDAVVSAIPDGAERVEIDGEVYYKLGDTLYKPVMVEGEVAYKVVKL